MALFFRRLIMSIWFVVSSPLALPLLVMFLVYWAFSGEWFFELFSELLGWKWPQESPHRPSSVAKTALALLLVLAAGVLPACNAQTMTVAGSHVQDAAGNPCASCRITFAPVDSSGRPISFRIGGGGQVQSNPVSANVTNGAFTIVLPDVSMTNPQNVCFKTTVVDRNTGVTVLGPAGYTCVQPSSTIGGWCTGSTCNFDAFVPNIAGIPVQTISGGFSGGTVPNATTFQAPVTLAGDPTQDRQAATKEYVDANAGTPNWAAPGTLGSTTPNSGAFTNVTAQSVATNGTGPSGYTVTPNSVIPTAPTNSITYSAPRSVPTPYALLPPTNVTAATATPLPMQCQYFAGPPAYLQCALTAITGAGLPSQWAAGQVSANYYGLGLNDSLSNTGILGILADHTGADPNLYLTVPTGGAIVQKVAGAGVAETIAGNHPTGSCSGNYLLNSAGDGFVSWCNGAIYVNTQIGSSASWTGDFQTQSIGGNYSDWSFNDNHANGTRLGMIGGNSSSGDPNLYLDVPAGGSFKFRVNNVAFGQGGLISGAYGGFSINSSLSSASFMGVFGDTSGTDPNLYFNAPTGGQITLKIANVTAAVTIAGNHPTGACSGTYFLDSAGDGYRSWCNGSAYVVVAHP